MSPFTNTWDEAAPNGATVDADKIDDVIQALKKDVRERLQAVLGMDMVADPQVITKLGDALGINQKQIKPTLVTTASSGANHTVDWNNGINQAITLTANCTLAFSNPVAGTDYSLILSQDGTGGRTITFPATVRWTNASSAPTLVTIANRVSRIYLYYTGSVYLASLGGTGYNVS